ncbi:MAG: hypothetical protein ACQEXJ_14845 [Myxococcota bacterium]
MLRVSHNPTSLLAFAMAACVLVAARPAAADETIPGGTEHRSFTGEVRGSHAESEGPVWLDHDLRLRFRPELIVGGDLGPGESGIPAPLTATPTNDDLDDDSLLAWASMRLRYQGVLHVGAPLSIHFGVDALDDLVLGSTHVNAGGSFADGLWRDSQVAPQSHDLAFRNSVRVKYAYLSWWMLETLQVQGGRMTDHFGMGLLRNRGDCPDCDFGTYVDGARLGFSIQDIRIEGSWEKTDSGATTTLPGVRGQPKDLGRADDARTFTLRVVSRPRTRQDREARRRDLLEGNRMAFDWGVFSALTDQDLSSSEQDLAALGLDCPPLAVSASGGVALPHRCWRLVPRDAFFWRPSGWLRTLWRPDPATHVRLEAEFGAMIGSVDNLQRRADLEDTDKDFVGFGGALEAEVEMGRYGWGLDMGYASGDDRRFLGVLDGQNIVEPDDGVYEDNLNVATNDTVTSFWFDRDYRVDLILFRQVIGAVTNAVYAKPWVSYDLLDTDSMRLGARLDVLYAAAARPSGTPGNGRHYGVEVDGGLHLELPDGFGARLDAGFLVPMGALDDRETGASPDPAFSVRGLMTWRY